MVSEAPSRDICRVTGDPVTALWGKDGPLGQQGLPAATYRTGRGELPGGGGGGVGGWAGTARLSGKCLSKEKGPDWTAAQ